MSDPVRLVYFAWVRERIGLSGEEVELPPGIATVADLLEWLKGRGETYAEALRHAPSIRVALDRRHTPHNAALKGAREIALFPPMTGG